MSTASTVSAGIRLTLQGAPGVRAAVDGMAGAVDRLDAKTASGSASAASLAGSLSSVGLAAGGAASGASRASAAIGSIGAAAKTVAGLAIAQQFLQVASAAIQAADGITTLRNQLQLATGSAAAASQAYEALFGIAQRSRTSFTDLGGTFASIARATDGLGISQARLLRVTESIGNAMAIGSGSAAGMQAALTQLGQGFASGTLRGEELNSVMEQAPRLARAIADGMGVTVGQLRALGAEGKITAEAVLTALESQAETLSREVGGSVVTVAQAFTQLGNSATKAIGQLDEATGTTSSLAAGIQSMSSVIDDVSDRFSRARESGLGFFGSLAASQVMAAAEALGHVDAAAANVGRRLQDAEKDLAALQLRFAQRGGFYLAQEVQKAEELRDRLREAKQAQDDLKAERGTSQSQQFGQASASLDAMARKGLEDQARDEEKLAGIRAKLSGVSADYTKTLRELQALREKGRIDEPEYIRLVSALATANHKAKDSTKGLGDSYRSMIAASVARVAMMEAEEAGGGRLTQGDRKLLEMQAAIEAGTVAYSQKLYAAAAAQFQLEAAEERGRQTREAATAGTLANVKAREAEITGLAAATAAIEDQVAEQLAINAAGRAGADVSGKLAAAKLREAAASSMAAANKAEERSGDLALGALYRQNAAELLKLAAAQEAAMASSVSGDARASLDAFLDPAKAETFGDALRDAFGGAASALVKLSGALQDYGRKQAAIEAERSKVDKIDNPYERYGLEMKLNEKSADQQIEAYANIAGAAKGFFDEGSKGYKTLQAAETAFQAYQLASDLVKGASAAAVAVANQAQGDPYTAWFRMAAMAAAMGTLGFAVAGGFNKGGAAPSAADRQAENGTGTVLGDAQAKSESIARSIAAIEDTARIELETQSGMLRSLRNIESALAGLGNIVARSGGITSGSNLGIRTGVLATNQGDALFRGTAIDSAFRNDPILGGIVRDLQSLWGKTKAEITDSGLSLSGTVGDLSAGRGVRQYADVTTTQSSWFGLKKDTSTATQFGEVSGDLAAQFGLVFKNVGAVLQGAAGQLGRDGGAVADAVAQFTVDIPRLSLKGLTGDELQEAISTAISAMSDTIAHAALAGVEAFQQIGEGYFETVVRVAAGVETAAYELELLGIAAVDFGAIVNKQGDVAAEIVRESILAAETVGGTLSNVGKIISTFDGDAEGLASTFGALVDVRDTLRAIGISGEALNVSMVRGAGGLDALAGSLDAYMANYLTDQERTAAGLKLLGEQFSALGYTLPTTRDGFREIIESIDPMTTEGSRLLAQLLALGDAFAELVPAAESAANIAEKQAAQAKAIAQERAGLETQYLQLIGDTVELRRREREALDATNRSLFDTINALSDLESLTDKLRSAVADAMAGVEKAVKGQQDALREALDGQLAQLDTAEQAARDAFEALGKQLDAEAEAARAIFDAQSKAIGSSLDALDAQAKAQAQQYKAEADALSVERETATDAYRAAAAAMDATIKAQTATVSKLKGLNDALAGTLRAMRPIGSEGADRARAQQQIASALAVARASGVLPSAEDLKESLSVVSKPSEDLFGSFEDYARDFYRTAIDIRDLSDIAGTQLADADTELQATIAVRDALQEAHEANIERLDGLKEALDLANEQARESIDLQRESLQAQLDRARDTLDGKLDDIQGRRDAAADALDQAIADITGQRDALNDEFKLQTAALEAILQTARDQYDALLGIESGVQSIPAALAALSSAMGALAAVAGGSTGGTTGAGGTGGTSVGATTGKWVTTGAVQTYTDTGGAVAIQATGNIDPSMTVIKGTNGAVLTADQAQQYVNDNIGTNAAGVATAAQQTGISSAGVDALMGYAAGTFDAVTGSGKVAGVTGSWTAQEIRDTVTAMLAAGDVLGIYELAKAEKISAATLDVIMGWPAGSANITATSMGLPAFASGGVHGGGLRLVGENGPELEVTGPSRIFNFDQTRELMSGGGNAELLAELQQLRREVAALRTESRAQGQAIAASTGKLARLHDRWDGDGLPEARDVTV